MKGKEIGPYYTNEKNAIWFWEEAVEHIIGGTPYHDKVLFIRVKVPGDNSEAVYEVEREYPDGHASPVFGKIKRNEIISRRFSDKIEQYKKDRGTGMVVDGVPLDEWPLIDIARAATLRGLGIHSVEALSDLNDAIIAKIGMGGRTLVDKAKTWLAQRKDSELAMKLAEEKKGLQDQVNFLKDQLEELKMIVSGLSPEHAAQAQGIASRKGSARKASEAA